MYDALNFLGRVKWRINKDVYDIIQEAWEQGLTVGDLPSREDVAMPAMSKERQQDEEEDDKNAWRG